MDKHGSIVNESDSSRNYLLTLCVPHDSFRKYTIHCMGVAFQGMTLSTIKF